MFAVLRRRDFALLWFSGLVSVAGDWVLMTALPYYVYVRTDSTIATAGMTAAELAPAILLSSVAGVFADRWNRKRILVISALVQAGTVLVLLLVRDDGMLWLVYVVAIAQSTVSSFAMPAEAALLPTLVPREEFVQANAMNTLNNRLGRLSRGPPGRCAARLVRARRRRAGGCRVVPGRRRAGRAHRRTTDGWAGRGRGGRRGAGTRRGVGGGGVLARVARRPARGPRRPDDRGPLRGVRVDDVRRDDDRPVGRAVDPGRARQRCRRGGRAEHDALGGGHRRVAARRPVRRPRHTSTADRVAVDPRRHLAADPVQRARCCGWRWR